MLSKENGKVEKILNLKPKKGMKQCSIYLCHHRGESSRIYQSFQLNTTISITFFFCLTIIVQALTWLAYQPLTKYN